MLLTVFKYAFNIIAGFLRIAVFLLYLIILSRLKEIKTLFEYHGAEHKTINAYESDAELTPEIVASFPKEHPRCGTGFLLVVVVFSVLIFAALGPMPLLWKWPTRSFR